MDQTCDSLEINMLNSKNWTVFTPITTILVTILYVVTVKIIGPNFIKNRPAIGNTPEMILKNIQLGINSYVFYNLILYSWIKINYALNGSTENISMKSFDMAQIFWFYFIGKALELLETVIYVLDKKTNKTTNPHVLFHILSFSFVWLTLIFESNTISFVFALLNTFIQLASCTEYLFGSHMSSNYFYVLPEIKFISMIFQTYVLVFLNNTLPKVIVLGALVMFTIVFIAFYIDPENEKKKEFEKKHKNINQITLEQIVKANMAT